MLRYSYILVFALLLLSNVELITSKRFSSGRHSYPKSGGLSGGGSHHYPSSGGLSGGGHGYPSSGGSHGYPSSGGMSGTGGSHGYPSSGGQSGGSHGYPSPGRNPSYPTSNTHTSNHGYPSGTGLSGNSHSGPGHTTNIHHHYNYNPPQQIRYTQPNGHSVNYPVYHGAPPTYVYKYKDSGSKYGTLLAGLALLNLGTLGVSAYALSKSGQNNNYKPQPGEVCKFGIKKDNGDYEETRIDCNLITSFIFQEEAKTAAAGGGTNTTVVTTVTNVTVVNTTNGETPPGPVNATDVNVNATANNATSDNTMTSSVTVTTTNTTTVTNALEVKGKPIDVTPGMQCYVISHSPTRNMKKSVPCGLLQSYAEQSLKKNSAPKILPTISIFSAILAILVAY